MTFRRPEEHGIADPPRTIARRMRSPPMARYLALILILTGVAAVEPAPSPGLARAQAALAAEQDEAERGSRKLVWGEDRAQAMPGDLDVLAMRGYFDRDLLSIAWRDGTVTARLARVERGNFHNRTPAGLVLQRVELDPVAFALTWDAVQRLIAVEDPPPPPDEDPERLRYPTGGGSTHAAYHLLTWRLDGSPAWSALPVLRHRSTVDGVCVLADLRMAAISRLLWELAPAAARRPEDPLSAEPAWVGLCRDLLPGCQGDGQSALSERSRLLSEDLARLLGDLGDDSDAARLTTLESGLWPSVPPAPHSSTSVTYWEDCVRAEAGRARMRIAMRLHWDAAAATVEIHGNAHRRFIDNQQEAWLRSAFHARDPEGYRALLLADLAAVDSVLVLESIGELARRHRREHRPELHRLLGHADPDVVHAAALAVMDIQVSRRGSNLTQQLTDVDAKAQADAQVADALHALERLAGDPAVPIPPGSHSFSGCARTRALNVLQSCPPPWHWDAERCRSRLADPAERDGRMVQALLFRTGIPTVSTVAGPVTPLSEEQKQLAIPLWRRCLADPPTRGTLLAMAELAALGDVESQPRMREIIATLRAGCNAGLSFIDDPTARFPWTDRYDLDNIEQKLGLKTP